MQYFYDGIYMLNVSMKLKAFLILGWSVEKEKKSEQLIVEHNI